MRNLRTSWIMALMLTLPIGTGVAAQSAVPASGAAVSTDCVPTAIGPDTEITLDVDGVQRSALLRAPSTTSSSPRPLVLAFHGYGGGMWDLGYMSGLSDLAEAEGFVVAYPQGIGEGPTWDLPGGSDIPFVFALIDELAASQCIDTGRVFATGYSMGGGMANVLACRFADRIAAIAPVAANHGETWGGSCAPSRPIPVMAFHGMLDSVLPYEGGESPFPDRLVSGVEEWMAEWARVDGCAPDPAVTSVSAEVDSLTWQGCAAPVVLYRVLGGGHTWPGGVNDPNSGPSTDDISASKLMWSFFTDAAAQVTPPAE